LNHVFSEKIFKHFLKFRFKALHQSGISAFQYNLMVNYLKFIDKLNNISEENADVSSVRNDLSTNFELNVRNLLIAFIMLIFGSMVSIIALCIELINRFKFK